MALSSARTPILLALLAYAALVVVSSLYPFTGWTGWHDWGLAFLGEPLPRYITRTDLSTNLLVYLPLGYALARLQLCQQRRRSALLVATVGGALFSVAMESLQQLLPGRITSNLDVFINTLGALVGALLALHHGRWLRAWRAAYAWRVRWFRPHGPTTLGLWLLLFWGFAHFSLQPMPGAGWLALHLRPADMAPPQLGQLNLTWFAVVFIEMLALGAFTATLLRPGRYASAMFLFVLAAFLLKLLAAAILLKLKVLGGIFSLETLVAHLLALWLLLLPVLSRHRHGLALFCLVLIAGGRLIWVEDPLWPSGSLLNIVGLASHVAALWPWLALLQLGLAWLAWRRLNRPAG